MNKIIKKHNVMQKITNADSFEVIKLGSDNPEVDQKYAVKKPRKMQIFEGVFGTLEEAKKEALLRAYESATWRTEYIRQELEELGITDDEVYKYC